MTVRLNPDKKQRHVTQDLRSRSKHRNGSFNSHWPFGKCKLKPHKDMTNSQSKGLETKQNKTAAIENSDLNSGEDVEKLYHLCPGGRNVE